MIGRKDRSNTFNAISFFISYPLATVFVVPFLAEINGRTALPWTKSGNLIPHNYMTPFLNRHYVVSALRIELVNTSNEINATNGKLKISYLDANFPFVDGFPVLPHLSHDDGRKVDLSFFYTKEKEEGILKPSISGYGKFECPEKGELDQTAFCKKNVTIGHTI